MEYLICSQNTIASHELVSIFNAKRISAQPVDSVLEVCKSLVVANGPSWITDQRFRYFSGDVLYANSYISNLINLNEANVVKFSKHLESGNSDIAGTYTLIESDRVEGVLRIHFDALNSVPCFYYSKGTQYFVSNNLHMVEACLRSTGIEVGRRIEPYLAEGVFFCGLLGGSPYQHIKVIKSNKFIELDHSLVLKSSTIIFSNPQEIDYNELVVEIGNRIARRVEILTALGKDVHPIVDITGGMDSRMLLAGIKKIDAVENWHFNRLFAYPNPDGNFAEMIGEMYSMKRSSTWHGCPTKRSFFEVFCREVYHSMGTENKRGITPQLVQPSLLRLHGSFGELGGKSQDTKRFYKRIEKIQSHQELIAAYMAAISEGPCGLGVTSSLLEWARSILESTVTDILDEGFTPEQLPAIFYSRSKARSHYGYLSHLRSMRTNYPNILCDPLLVQAAISLGARKSLLGKLNFDVIRYLGGDELASLPLVGGRWVPKIFDTNEERKLFVKPPITLSDQPLWKCDAEFISPPKAIEFELQSLDNQYFLGKLPATPAVPQKSMLAVQHSVLCVEEVREAAHQNLSGFIDLKVLDSLLKQKPEEVSRDYLSFLKLAATSGVWMAQKELPYNYS